MERESDNEEYDETNCCRGGDLDYVECGGYHTFVVTKTGIIFATGYNNCG